MLRMLGHVAQKHAVQRLGDFVELSTQRRQDGSRWATTPMGGTRCATQLLVVCAADAGPVLHNLIDPRSLRATSTLRPILHGWLRQQWQTG